jgi:hypothetical protein
MLLNLAFVLFTLAMPAAPAALRPPEDAFDDAGDETQEKGDRLGEVYDQAYEQMSEDRFESAIPLFDEVIREKGTRADAALYWKADVLRKLQQQARALETLGQLARDYPKSKYLTDAKRLEIELRGPGKAVPASGASEEEKILVLTALMQSDPEKAFPTVEQIIESPQSSAKLKDRALFLLCQSGSPKALEAVAKLARGAGDPDLQKKAVRDLGLFGGERASGILADIYASSADANVKKAILQSFMVSGNKAKLLAAAKGESSPDLRAAAINELGLVGAQSELGEMYQSATTTHEKAAILRAFFLGGNTAKLAEVAQTEKDPELRKSAIRNLGLTGATAQLAALYDKETDVATKLAVIDALFLSGDAKDLVRLGRAEKDPELRKQIVTKVGLMGSKDATDFLLEILNK